MKKIYNSPIITIVEVNMQSSLLNTASLGIKNENASSAGMSRSNSFDDED